MIFEFFLKDKYLPFYFLATLISVLFFQNRKRDQKECQSGEGADGE
jgi:hypothetical protein